MLNEPDADLRVMIIHTLRKLGPNATPAIPALVAALEDASEAIREVAAKALKRIRNQENSSADL